MTDIDKAENSKAGGTKPKYEIKDNETGKTYYSRGLDSTYDIIRDIAPQVSKYRVRMAMSRGDPVECGRFEIRRLDGKASLSKVATQPIPSKRLRNLKFKRKSKGPKGSKTSSIAAPVSAPVVEGVNEAVVDGLAPAKVVVVPHDQSKEPVVSKQEPATMDELLLSTPMKEYDQMIKDVKVDADFSQDSTPGASSIASPSTDITPVSLKAELEDESPANAAQNDLVTPKRPTRPVPSVPDVPTKTESISAKRAAKLSQLQEMVDLLGDSKETRQELKKHVDNKASWDVGGSVFKLLKDEDKEKVRKAMVGEGSGNVLTDVNLESAIVAEQIASIASRAKELALDPGVKSTQGARMAELLTAVEEKDADKARKILRVIEEHSSDYNLRNAEKDATEQAQLESTAVEGVTAVQDTATDSGLSEAEIVTLLNYINIAYKNMHERLTGSADIVPDIESAIRSNAKEFAKLVEDGGAGTKDVDTSKLLSALSTYVGTSDPVVAANATKPASLVLNPTIKIGTDSGILQGAGPVDDAISRRVDLATAKLQTVTDAIKEKETRMGYVLDEPSSLTDATIAENGATVDDAMEMQGSGLLDSAYKTYPENSPYVTSSQDLDEELMALSFSRKRHLRHGFKDKGPSKSRKSNYENFRRPDPKSEPNRRHDFTQPRVPYSHPGTVLSRNRPGEPMLQRPYYRTDLVQDAPKRGQSQSIVGDLAVTGQVPFQGRLNAEQERLFKHVPTDEAGVYFDRQSGELKTEAEIARETGRVPQPFVGQVGNGAPYGGYGFNPERGGRRFYDHMDDDDALLRGRGMKRREASDAVRAKKPGRYHYCGSRPGSSRSSHTPGQMFGQYVGMRAQDAARALNTEGWGIRIEYPDKNYASNYLPNRLRIKADHYDQVESIIQG
jgi:alkylhydroperoxidase family enzyme